MAQALAAQGERQQAISNALVSARREAGSLSAFPGQMPDSLASAYRVQAVSRSIWPDAIVGWKVGGIPPRFREALGADHLSGPIYARRLAFPVVSGATPMPVFAQGFAAIEPEFVLQMGPTRDQDRLFIGVEIASSPIVAINDIGPLAVVCDFGNNNGLLIGNEIENWRSLAGQELPIKTVINGECVGRKLVTDLARSVASACDFLFDLATRERIELSPGTYISTGAITGVHEAQVGDRSVLDFGDLGRLELILVAEQPLP
jgi:2-keto-4-pentenoate hydratase